MPTQNDKRVSKRRSLLTLLSSFIVCIVVIVLGIHGAHLYLVQKNKLNAALAASAQESLIGLKRNIAPFIEAYAVNEYSIIVATELHLRPFLAIVVEDFNMGNILGKEAYVTGSLINDNKDLVEFDITNALHQEQLDDVYLHRFVKINSTSGENIGIVSVYVTDDDIKRELRLLLLEVLTTTALLSFFLIGLLVVFINKKFILPLRDIGKAILLRDADGIPKKSVPDFNYKELSVLTDTINTMLNVVRKSRNELKHESTQLRNVIESTSVGTWVLNIEQGFFSINDRWAEIIGYAVKDLSPITINVWKSLFHPDDFVSVLKYFERNSLVGFKLYENEVRLRHKNGNWVWVLIRGRVSDWSESGHPILISGIFLDITERKHFERYENFRSITLENLTSSESLDSISENIVRGVENLNPDFITAIFMFDRDCHVIEKIIAPSLPNKFKNIFLNLNISVIDPVDNLHALFNKNGIIVEDISISSHWSIHKDLALSLNIHSSWFQSVFDDSGKVLGSLAIFQQKKSKPTDNDLRLMDEMTHLVSIAINRIRSNDKLRLSARIFDQAREGIILTDLKGNIIDVNDAFIRITHYQREEAIGQNPRFLNSGRHDVEFYTLMWDALKTHGFWSGEIWNKRKDGTEIAELLTINAIKDHQGNTQQYVAIFSDITAIKAHQSELEYIANFDPLTKLPNRLLLGDRLNQAMIQAQRTNQLVAVIFLDLDGFKSINDTYDHKTGDQVLVLLAGRMKQALRESDTIARVGGDEFVAVLSAIDDVALCWKLLDRLLDSVSLPVYVQGLQLQLSASLGVTFYPQSHQNVEADQLLRQADHAMYQAKVAGKNRYCVFDTEHESSIRNLYENLERIRLAITRKEFVLYYQPKVNMHTGEVVGAEALIRWQHPEKGLLAPMTFLPVIENHPLAIELGEWVIDTALIQVQQWQSAGLDLCVSVNISAFQLQQDDFVQRLQHIMSSHSDVIPKNLELEVLETSALADLDKVSQIISDCSVIGVKFALDDFGTGYSTLTYLKKLKVATLKIDQSFVRDMLDDADDMAILQGIIGLAEAFNRDVIAEGVETVEHGSALLALGCELAQGYGIAKPMPPEKLPGWIVSWSPDPLWQSAYRN